ncbi:PREDICTED: nodal homolog [Nanorana parkeri]|uniref:nodal homolog n=1 Tax=Nanorana parkeri TaxID=125878 RepID=UPI00085491B6|nr:PREDICTED: nodal homolog [Nanorana parkeri]
MSLSLYCILILLLIPGAANYIVRNYLRHEPASQQAFSNRTEEEVDKNVVPYELPNFMMSLYQSFHRLETRQGTELGPASLQRSPSSPQADIIRSLAAKEFEQVDERCILVFDFSSLSRDEQLEFAEVRLHKSALTILHSDGMPLVVDIFHQDSTCQAAHKLCQNYVYLGSATCKTGASESWLVVEASAIVRKWFERNDKADDSTPVHLKHAEKMSGVENAKRRYKDHKSEDHQVLMFVYSNLSKKERSSVTATLLLDAAQSKYLATSPLLINKSASRRRRRSHMIRDRIISIKQAPPTANKSNLCKRVDLIVDFRMIGWDAWIIHPKKFNAYRCEGSCPSPVNESVKPNNHSYLQSLVNLYNSAKAPEVCCVPIRMSSLSMAYYDNMDIAFQSHEAMIVEECGCQ